MKDKENFDKEDVEFENDKKDGFYQPDQNPETETETTRKGLMAYGALTTLIGAILAFMAIGWLIDYKFATSPWGIVGGIIVGSILGFYQFIRVSSPE